LSEIFIVKTAKIKLTLIWDEQGEQIGRKLRCFIYGHFYESYKILGNSWAIFFTEKVRLLNLDKDGLGYVLGDFFSQKHLVTLGTSTMIHIFYWAHLTRPEYLSLCIALEA
jgi:hypothetical protein